jgi:hypothetical protein
MTPPDSGNPKNRSRLLMNRQPNRTLRVATSLIALSSFVVIGYAADDTSTPPATQAAGSSTSDTKALEDLKQQVTEQQKQIEEMRLLLLDQKRQIDSLKRPAPAAEATEAPNAAAETGSAPAVPDTSKMGGIGDVASLAPVLPPVLPIPKPAAAPFPVAAADPLPAYPQPLPQGASSSATTGNPCEADASPGPVPAYLRFGNVCIVPIGFMDFTPFWRDKDAGSSMGSNFGSVPYNNVATGNLSEAKFTLQNSRLGLRVDGDWKGTHFIGYNEFDFNGTSGAANMAVTNGAIVPRLRLFWVDLRRGKVEFLAGQSWSMLTPNRTGLSALPGDLFYGQEIDINYLAGLTWTRQGGARIIWHPSNKVAWGFSVEQPDQYMGGSTGGSAIVLPSALTGLATTQLDNGAGLSVSPAGSYLATPTLTPDFISKIAFDPSSRFHFEVGGIISTFRIALNQAPSGAVSIAAPYNLHSDTYGAGLLFGINAAVTKNFRLITTDFWNDGQGRYLFGQAPDVVVSANGSLHPLHSAASIDGFEATIGRTLLYAYYGGIYIDRDVAIDANGTSLVGYGYHGSANSQNREINEITGGFNQTIWRDPRYGAVNFMGQYEWLQRAPWYVAAGAPKGTHDNTVYLDVRYTLPGSMPNF